MKRVRKTGFSGVLGIAGALALAAWLASRPASAVETDQYLMWTHPELHDATDLLNGYVNSDLEKLLEKLQPGSRTSDESEALSCRAVVSAVMHHFVDQPGFAAVIEDWPWHDSRVEMFPPASWSREETLDATIYRNLTTYLAAPFGNNLRINGVNIGADKLGHFMSQGLEYYDIYRDTLDRAQDEGVFDDQDQAELDRKAVIAAIDNGVHQEKTIYGYWAGGVFSYADLEANYQGFLFARKLCSGRGSYLEDRDGKWVLARKIDFRDYVDPNWDESFNTSDYDRFRWPNVKPLLKRYCWARHVPRVEAIMADYRARVRENDSTRRLAELIRAGEISDPSTQKLDRICGENP